MTLFSERMGVKTEKAIQIGDMDTELRNGLWNCLWSYFIRLGNQFSTSRTRSIILNDTYMELLAEPLWRDFLKRPLDELQPKWRPMVQQFKGYYMSCPWYEAYDFLEVVAQASLKLQKNAVPGFLGGASWANLQAEFIHYCNDVLKRENAGYRFVSKRIVPVTSEAEMVGIEEALAATTASDPLRLVNNHLERALALLSDRHAPDYRNSMKESISAVECLCKLITKNEKGTLGQMLTAIEARGTVKLHKSIVEAFKQLYNYSCDSDGIRHALKDEPTVDVEDAKYMLVSCAGFVSYAIAKAQKAGITL